jgi:serine phosphatase RsbU (regulator of sigma subunit)
VKNSLFITLVILLSHPVYAQNTSQKLETIEKQIAQTKKDTSYVNLLIKLTDEQINLSRYNESNATNTEIFNLSKKLTYPFGVNASYYYEGLRQYKTNKYKESLANFEKCREYFVKKKLTTITIDIYSYMGRIHYAHGNFFEAQKYYLQALTISEQIGDLTRIAGYSGNLGAIFNSGGDNDKAMEYYQKSLAINEQINNQQGIAINKVCLANLYSSKKNYTKGLEVALEALEINKKIDNPNYLSNNYATVGMLYNSLDRFDSAIVNIENAMKIFETQKNAEGISHCELLLALNYKRQKKYAEAEKHGLRCLEISKKNGFIARYIGVKKYLSDIYFGLEDYKQAVVYSREYTEEFDSIQKIDRSKALYKQQTEFDYAKKEALAQAEFRRLQDIKQFEIERNHQAYLFLENKNKLDLLELESSNLQLKKKQAETKAKSKELTILKKEKQLQASFAREKTRELNQQKMIRNGFIVGAFLLSLLVLVAFRSWKQTKNKNAIIEAQKNEVEIQKTLAEQHNLEITDSINYALRIQQAILPSTTFVNSYLPNNYILYLPKSIVAGDFYFMENFQGKTIVAVADSTGHGVPGAMVSVVCSNALNRSIHEFGLVEPGKILDKTRDLVLETFAKSNEEIKDGMDISICVLDSSSNSIKWSGANNPLWYVIDGDFIEIKGDKQPVGKAENPTPFTTHEISIQQETQFFLFTDGFADQFGGEKGKKLKYKPFAEILKQNLSESLERQQQLLHDHFTTWKGNHEQVDDVSIISFVLTPNS